MRRFLRLPYRDSCPMPGFIDFPLSRRSQWLSFISEKYSTTPLLLNNFLTLKQEQHDQYCQVLLPAGTGMWPYLELIYISFDVLLLFRNKLIPYLGLLFSQVAGFTRWGLALRYYSLYSIFPCFFSSQTLAPTLNFLTLFFFSNCMFYISFCSSFFFIDLYNNDH